MAINLVKGQTIDLRKGDKGESFDLSSVTIGLGWDVRVPASQGFFGKLMGGGKKENDFDLDAVAFLLDANDKVADRGKTVRLPDGRNIDLYEGDIIYFNSQKHPSGNIWLTGDNRTGQGDGDDEQIIVKLDSLDQRYQKIVFLVCIYRGITNNQHFGMVENAYIRAVDKTGKEIAKYTLSGAEYNGMCTMVFGEAYRKDTTWKFRALGEAHPADSFTEVLKRHV